MKELNLLHATNKEELKTLKVSERGGIYFMEEEKTFCGFEYEDFEKVFTKEEVEEFASESEGEADYLLITPLFEYGDIVYKYSVYIEETEILDLTSQENLLKYFKKELKDFFVEIGEEFDEEIVDMQVLSENFYETSFEPAMNSKARELGYRWVKINDYTSGEHISYISLYDIVL